MAWMFLASSLLLVRCFARFVYRWYRLSHIPGPFWTSFRFDCSCPPSLSLSLRRIHDQHGMMSSSLSPPNLRLTYSRAQGVLSVSAQTKLSHQTSIAFWESTPQALATLEVPRHHAQAKATAPSPAWAGRSVLGKLLRAGTRETRIWRRLWTSSATVSSDG